MIKIFRIALLVLFSTALVSESVYAIPAFARKYKMSCQTCHSPFPKLKAFGDEFAGNGFVLADQDAPRYFLDTGDESLNLIRDFPMAIRMDLFVTYRNKDEKLSDFKTPFNLKFLTGGALAKDVSYYFYFFLSEGGEIVGVEDAFLMFNNLFDTELDLFVGQFQVSDPLFKRELRLSFEDYHAYKNKVGISQIDLTYDRGLMLTYGMDTGTDFVFEVLNGTGIGVKNGFDNFDNDEFKNFFGRITQDIVEGVRIGAFGYTGKEKLMNDMGNSATNKVTMYGPDLTINLKDKLEFNFQYVHRQDDEVFLTSASTLPVAELKTKGFFGEMIYTPQGDESKWYCLGLYNWVDSDFDELDYKSASAHFGYLINRNIRFVSEFTYDFVREYGQFGVGIVTAF
ncbi:MAG: hypothetical protein KKA84_07135 [Bacteroidetes bacterium]|nr:hypothetical protein [Bacteroidota bacterium]